ncbi:DEAD/DEAH box helicase [Acidaminobacter sp. JC074]|uniref:DEAD/DEAH box helicase n=1 Tax=Acidaminobacter sp. JC074 TaxID=2530199 RepID=UPI001F0FC420|nr:DEAD/DEAH box helicase [Acidaminobacter sp. JC074]
MKKTLLYGYFTEDSFYIEKCLGLEDLYDSFSDKYEGLFNLTFKDKEHLSPGLIFLHDLSSLFLKRLSEQSDLEISRQDVEVPLLDEDLTLLLEELPLVLGAEHVTSEWLHLQWQHLNDVFSRLILDYEDTVEKFLNSLDENIHVADRIYFHLVENKQSDLPFAFIATYSVKTKSGAKHMPLMHAFETFKDDQKKLIQLIASVTKIAGESDFISEILESGELFSPLELNAEEAYDFLKDVHVYKKYGIMCRIPNWWKKKNPFKMSVTLGDKKPSKVGLDALMDFKPTLSLNGLDLTEEELREFLEMAEGLLLYKGQWIEINKKNIEKALEALEHYKVLSDGQMTVSEALRMQIEEFDHDTDIDVSFDNGMWLKDMYKALSGQIKQTYPLEDSFKAQLRHYQNDGYNWLNQMNDFGFGACLADDMGLGKTVQVIAFLEKARKVSDGQALLILPASLIGNWVKEVEKFAPEMTYQILHKSRLKKGEELELSNEYLVMTTYTMAKKLDFLRDKTWDYLILDEAQAIKNPGTKQTKAIKEIPAKMKIAMTGTPIENRLDDLWSLFDFMNQGLLGTPKEFKTFSKSLKDNPYGYSRLRKMIQPFLLRRMKTDPKIISDLPDKLEMNTYTGLTKKQEVLYKKLLKDIESKIGEAEGINRRGLVLASIMKFKQICNHPDQYLGNTDYKPENSGKFMQLKDICETIYEKRERVLVFTQFKEMTGPIADYLSTIFKKEGLVLHGGTPVKKRQEMVEAFNGEDYIPFMVLSLKAGGVGLNLTGANHAIHFDRWWNPAVENQATDRIFRIGQKKKVMVHKFVTTGTIEDKINDMIEEKIKLSGEILSETGEKWLTEYNDEELMKLFSLGGE